MLVKIFAGAARGTFGTLLRQQSGDSVRSPLYGRCFRIGSLGNRANRADGLLLSARNISRHCRLFSFWPVTLFSAYSAASGPYIVRNFWIKRRPVRRSLKHERRECAEMHVPISIRWQNKAMPVVLLVEPRVWKVTASGRIAEHAVVNAENYVVLMAMFDSCFIHRIQLFL